MSEDGGVRKARYHLVLPVEIWEAGAREARQHRKRISHVVQERLMASLGILGGDTRPPEDAADVMRDEAGERHHCRLAVDFHPERISDLADATKVAVRDGRVTDIGKEITNYNAIDTGIFLCTRGIFEALETAISRGRETLSDGVR